jgi:hypothetical protein
VWQQKQKSPSGDGLQNVTAFTGLKRLAAVAMLADKGLHGFQLVWQNGATLVSLKQIRKMCR